jgi:hypothetical protein
MKLTKHCLKGGKGGGPRWWIAEGTWGLMISEKYF